MKPRLLFSLRPFLIVAVAMAGWLLLGLAAEAQTPGKQTSVMLATDNGFVSINAEIADTPEARERGLMNRTDLPDNRGMLFLWDEPINVTMWMRNTPLSLDMIFIRPTGVIHRIASNTVPYSEDLISSRGEVLGVLEVRGGLARQLGLRPGHRVHHPAFKMEE